jgi:hypothetical protein
MVVTITYKAAQELSTRTSKHMSRQAELEHLGYIEVLHMWHQDRYKDLFNAR